MPTDPRQEFIDAVVAPLDDDDEIQLLARSRLDERLASDAVGLPRIVRRGSGLGWWMLAVAALSILLLGRPVSDLYRVITAYDGSMMFGIPAFDEELIRERFAKGRERDTALLLVGDWTQGTDEARWRALWRAEPDDPGALGKYLLACVSDSQPVPDELLEDIRRVDPGNGWYDFIRAAAGSMNVVEEDFVSRADRKAGKEQSWTIHDEAELDRVIRLASRAVEYPRFDNPLHGLVRAQAEQLGEVTDLRSSLVRSAFVYQDGPPAAVWSVQMLGRAFAAAAWRCGNAGQDEELRHLMRVHRKLGRRLCDDPDTLLELLLAQVFIKAPLEDFVRAAEKSGLSGIEEAQWAVKLEAALEQRREARIAAEDPERDEWIDRRGASMISGVASGVFNQVSDPPVVSESMLKPGRRAEQAVVGRAFAMGAWVVLALAGAVMALRMKLSDRVDRRLAGSLDGVFRTRDRLMVSGIGVLGPVLGFLAVRYLTPLGGLNWGAKHTLWPTHAVQWSALVVLLLWWPGVLAAWRCRRRLGCLGLGKSPGKSSVAGLIIVATMIPLAGLAGPESGIKPLIAIAGTGTLGVVAFLGAGSLVVSLLRRGSSLDRALQWRLTGPALLAAVMACLALAVLFRMEELYWYRQDTMNVPADGGMFCEYEARIAGQLKAELRGILDAAG